MRLNDNVGIVSGAARGPDRAYAEGGSILVCDINNCGDAVDLMLLPV